jgi:hypothetical protein
VILLNIDKDLTSGRDFFIKFATELKSENRFFIDPDYLEIFDAIISQHSFVVKKHSVLYRGRVNRRDDTTAYMGADIGMPSPEISTSHGRANPYGINYMYLSNNPNTVIAELRPNIGDFISIGQFTLTQPKKVIKLSDSASISGTIYDKWDSLFVSNFMMYLINSFSRPIDANKKELEYLPSQYFSEYCKKKGFDGVMFLSSVMKRNSLKNYNYVFFDDTDVVYKSTDVHFVSGLKYNSNKA